MANSIASQLYLAKPSVIESAITLANKISLQAKKPCNTTLCFAKNITYKIYKYIKVRGFFMKPVKTPEYFHAWEHYAAELKTEYQQSYEEGLDIEMYKELFDATIKLADSPYKEKVASVLNELVNDLPIRKDYEYVEPSSLEGIKAERNLSLIKKGTASVSLRDKVAGAWYGRICGCLLGKPIECAWTRTIHEILKNGDNFPMHRYIKSTDLNDEILERSNAKWLGKNKSFIDLVKCAPFDDDTNYTVMAQCMLDDYGIDFTPTQVLETWMKYQPKNAYCTAERVAYMNFLKSYLPPYTAIYKNPYREWIGAQIRGDYYGYVSNDLEKAAELAWRDASISHIKNGIYGEMLISSMLAFAKENENVLDVIYAGLSQIPQSSRLYKQAMELIEDYKSGATQNDAFNKIHSRYNNEIGHDWCHTISNALIVIASLLYGEGKFGKSICMAVETGFDTDCNGATVGSIIGMMYGIDNIEKEWLAPINGMLETQILGHDLVKVDDLVAKTLEHIEKYN